MASRPDHNSRVLPHPGAETKGLSGPSQFLNGLAAMVRGAYEGDAIPSIAPNIPYPNIGVGYSVQETNNRIWIEGGRELVGRKIGRASPETQAEYKVERADFGFIYADMVHQSGAGLALDQFKNPRLTAEIALFLKEDVPERPSSPEEFLSKIESAAAAIEISDSRIHNWEGAALDFAADNACAGAIVIGERKPIEEVGYMADLSIELLHENTCERQGVSSSLIGGPIGTAIIAAIKMRYCGRPLLAGDIVLTGAVSQHLDASSGGNFKAVIEDLGSAMVHLS